MKQALTWSFLLYVIALHTSMAGMEICGWLVIALTIATRPNLTIWNNNRTLNLWLGAIVLVVFASLLSLPQEKGFWFQFGFMRWTLVLWGLSFALCQIWSAEFEQRLLSVWWVTVAVAGAYGAFQCLTGIDLIRHDAVISQGGGLFKATGFYSESMIYCYSLGLSVLAAYVPVREHKGRLAAGSMFLFGTLGIVASMARGAWLAWLAVTCAYLFIHKRRLVAPAIAVFGATVGGLAMVSEGLSRRIVTLAQFKMDHSGSVRMDLWNSYWHMFLDHPLLGIGLLEGDKLLPKYYAQLGLSPWYLASDGVTQLPFVSHAHNNLLQWLAGTGILGLICYVTVSFIFLRKAWRLRAVSDWGWSLFLAQVYLHLGGLTEANFIWGAVNHMIMFVWALTLTIEQVGATKTSEEL